MGQEQIQISILYLRSLLEYLESTGIKLSEFLQKGGYADDLMEDYDSWVPVDTVHHLWELAATYTADPDVGLHVGEKATIGRWGLVEYLVLNSGSLREVIENTVKYWRLMLNYDKTIVVGQEGKMAKLSFFSKSIRCRYFYEADLVYSIRMAQQILTPSFRPIETRLAYAKPKDLSEYYRILGCKLRFNSPTYSVLFPYEFLDQRLPKSNPILLSILQEHASGVLADMMGKTTLAEKVERFIQINLPNISIECVAEHLYLSVRTLQRRLKEEQKSFRELLDEARKKKAHNYLVRKNISLGEIAFMLGFSEPSAFNQAAKRWFGMTPGNYRSKNLKSEEKVFSV
jgi:AraC-like DNA-binding protein